MALDTTQLPGRTYHPSHPCHSLFQFKTSRLYMFYEKPTTKTAHRFQTHLSAQKKRSPPSFVLSRLYFPPALPKRPLRPSKCLHP